MYQCYAKLQLFICMYAVGHQVAFKTIGQFSEKVFNYTWVHALCLYGFIILLQMKFYRGINYCILKAQYDKAIQLACLILVIMGTQKSVIIILLHIFWGDRH